MEKQKDKKGKKREKKIPWAQKYKGACEETEAGLSPFLCETPGVKNFQERD